VAVGGGDGDRSSPLVMTLVDVTVQVTAVKKPRTGHVARTMRFQKVQLSENKTIFFLLLFFTSWFPKLLLKLVGKRWEGIGRDLK
jgi:hypothetical protein